MMTKGICMARAVVLAAAVSLAIACGPTTVRAQAAPEPPQFQSSGNAAFDAWRADFARRAVERGRDPAVLARLLSGVSPDPRIIELDQRQPEFVAPVWDYVTNRVTARRIQDG